MKFFKKNQVVIYVIALMLVVAGYLNYTTGDPAKSILTNGNLDEASRNSNIGDAELVSSTDVQENSNQTGTENQTANTENIVNAENTQNSGTYQETENSEIAKDNQSDIDNTNTQQDSTTSNIVEENIISEETINSNTSIPTSTKSTDDSYFTNSKLERETMYSQMIETYEKVLNSTNALEVQKQSATDEITKINNTKNSIMICENLIGTKGFDKNVIFVNGDSVTVIIGAEELKEEDVAQIQNIISRELNASIENIHIAIK